MKIWIIKTRHWIEAGDGKAEVNSISVRGFATKKEADDVFSFAFNQADVWNEMSPPEEIEVEGLYADQWTYLSKVPPGWPRIKWLFKNDWFFRYFVPGAILVIGGLYLAGLAVAAAAVIQTW